MTREIKARATNWDKDNSIVNLLETKCKTNVD